jgi:tetratricopeptide (TPR) repeat protein
MLVAAKSLVAYLWKMLVPLDLIPYYPYPKEVALFSLEYLSVIAFAVAITVACVVMLKKQKRLYLSVWTYYVVTLIPVLGLVQVGGQSMADRYTYLPSIGAFLLAGLLVAWSLERLRKKTPAIAYPGAATVIFLLLFIAFLTVKQMQVWQNSLSLWTYVIEKDPDRVPLAYNNRGRAFYGKGQFDQAIEDFNKAIMLDPLSSKAYLNRGAVLVERGQLDQAAADFNKAIALNPRYHEAYNARGSLLGMSGYLDRAIEQFDRAIEIDPGYSAAYVNRGSVYAMIGQNARALEDLDRAIQLDRYYAENYLIRGNIYLATGNKELAAPDFRRACDLGNESGCSSLQSVSIMTTNQGK